MAKNAELPEASSWHHCDGTEIQKGPLHSIRVCAQVDVWSKAGVLCIWNAFSLQKGMEQSSDTAYMFQSSYFSLDITQAHDKLHVNKVQN